MVIILHLIQSLMCLSLSKNGLKKPTLVLFTKSNSQHQLGIYLTLRNTHNNKKTIYQIMLSFALATRGTINVQGTQIVFQFLRGLMHGATQIYYLISRRFLISPSKHFFSLANAIALICYSCLLYADLGVVNNE